jgi:hypothetical protein
MSVFFWAVYFGDRVFGGHLRDLALCGCASGSVAHAIERPIDFFCGQSSQLLRAANLLAAFLLANPRPSVRTK